MRVVASLDGWAAMRDFAGDDRNELAAAASLAELAGADALRLSIHEDLAPVRETDVDTLRRTARQMELQMPVSQSLLKVALEARPDRIVLVGERHEASGPAPPLDARVAGAALGSLLRALEEADLRSPLVTIEGFTGYLLDLPGAERQGALMALGDTARLATKLRMRIAVAGGIDDRNVGEVLASAPSAERVVLGHALARRALLVGLDRALRDFRDRMR